MKQYVRLLVALVLFVALCTVLAILTGVLVVSTETLDPTETAMSSPTAGLSPAPVCLFLNERGEVPCGMDIKEIAVLLVAFSLLMIVLFLLSVLLTYAFGGSRKTDGRSSKFTCENYMNPPSQMGRRDVFRGDD